MSLTQTHHVFAGVAESGINTFLKALFTARPRYLNYGSPLFVPASTVNATNIAAIPFPGVPGGIQYAVSFSIPVVDLFPPNAGTLSPIPPGNNQLGLHTTVTLVLGCMTWSGRVTGAEGHGQTRPIVCKLDVWALGEIVPHYFGPGTGFITFQVDDVRIPAIKPDCLQNIIDCLIRMMLNGALSNVQLPFNALSAGAFKLILEQGPQIDNDMVEVWGSI
jgi:hypothetical protein